MRSLTMSIQRKIYLFSLLTFLFWSVPVMVCLCNDKMIINQNYFLLFFIVPSTHSFSVHGLSVVGSDAEGSDTDAASISQLWAASSSSYLLYTALGVVGIWLDKETIPANLPDVFQHYSDTQVVLVCTELYWTVSKHQTLFFRLSLLFV